MKKSALINSELSYLAATMGHTDEITICDAGLPIPDASQRVDLALIPGIPAFIDTVKALLSEMTIEGVVIAEEFQQVSPNHHQELMAVLDNEQSQTGKEIRITYLAHEDFKAQTVHSKAIVRTGEFTPYANIIFQAGVVF